MEISGRPLLATRVDEPLYLERGNEGKILSAVLRGLNSLIIGDAGSGKTSLLHRLELKLRQQDSSVIYIDGRLSEELDEILDNLRIKLGIKWPPAFHTSFDFLKPSFDGPQPPKSGASAEQTMRLLIDSMDADNRWIVLMDSPAREIAHTLFGRLRDNVWQLPITWIVSADSSASDAFRRAPADAFFEHVERIADIGSSEAQEILIRRGVAEGIARQVSKNETTPRLVLDFARRSILEPQATDKLQKSEGDFWFRFLDASRAAAMLATELRGQGAISASDKDIQRRMGWTRERLTQVLKELEAAGLAKATDAADGKPGRPRRYYEILQAP